VLLSLDAAIGSTAQALAMSGTYTQSQRAESQPPTVIDRGDFYWASGKKVGLRRSSEEVVVGLRDGSDSNNTIQLLTEQRGPLAGYRVVSRFGRDDLVAFAGPPKTAAAVDALVSALQVEEGIAWAASAFVTAENGSRVWVTDELIVSLMPGVDPRNVFGQNFSSYRRLRGTDDQYVVKLARGGGSTTLSAVAAVRALPGVNWAEPNPQIEIHLAEEPLLDEQWHLKNSGLRGELAQVESAWSLTKGSPEIVIAVLDVGVQMDHEDLVTNIFKNPREIANNGQDDDGNGYTDDANGWDFYQSTPGDNDPRPGQYDHHGTAVAGVAAAMGENGKGGAGVAYRTKIMPIKIGTTNADGTGTSTSPERLAEAIRYAAGGAANGGTWRGADVLVNSWSLDTTYDVINSAIAWAADEGRGGFGAPVFFAAGNDATGYQEESIPGLLDMAAGTYAWVIKYSAGTANGTTTRLAELDYGDGTSGLYGPTIYKAKFDEWSAGNWDLNPFQGAASWELENDRAFAYGTSRYQVRPANVAVGGQAVIKGPEFSFSGGTIPNATVFLWLPSDPANSVEIQLARANVDESGQRTGQWTLWPRKTFTGDPSNVTTGVSYPANLEDAIAVGASTDWNYRAAYSQYGDSLDFVAPSGGGYSGIVTTDRSGEAGYNTFQGDSGNYTDTAVNWLSGTSFAAPFAAGIAALMLSRNPGLHESDVRTFMRQTARKIGLVSGEAENTLYSAQMTEGTFSQYYGFGLVDARAALDEVTADQSGPSYSSIVTPDTGSTDSVTSATAITLTIQFGERVVGTTEGITATGPSGPISWSSIYWSGSMALKIDFTGLSQEGTYTVTLPADKIFDQAGNAMSGGQVQFRIDRTSPSITSMTSLPADGTPRTTPVQTVEVVMSEQVDQTSLRQSISLMLTPPGGTATSQSTSGLTVTLKAGTASTYTIGGLTAVTGADGHYELTLNAQVLKDLAGNALSGGNNVIQWEAAVPPKMLAMKGGPNQYTKSSISTVDVEMSEQVTIESLLSALTLTRPGGGQTILTANLKSGTTSTYTIGGINATTQGTYVLSLDATMLRDLAGNAGVAGPSDTRKWTLDQTKPTVTISGTNAENELWTKFARITLKGTTVDTLSPVGMTWVRVRLSTTLVTSTKGWNTVVVARGKWSYGANVAATDVQYCVDVKAVDAAGNVSNVTTVPLYVDGDLSVPVLKVYDPGTKKEYDLTSNPVVTVSQTASMLDIRVNAEARSTVKIYKFNALLATVIMPDRGWPDPMSKWAQIQIPSTVSDPLWYPLVATCTDDAGRIKTTVRLYIGIKRKQTLAAMAAGISAAPPALAIRGVGATGGEEPTGGDGDVTNNRNLVLHGWSLPQSDVSVSLDGVGAIGAATANDSGAWTFDYSDTTLADGVYMFRATLDAPYGSTAQDAALAIHVGDVDVPQPQINYVLSGGNTAAASQSLSGTQNWTFEGNASGGAKVLLRAWDGNALATAVANDDGDWSIDLAYDSLPGQGANDYYAEEVTGMGTDEDPYVTISDRSPIFRVYMDTLSPTLTHAEVIRDASGDFIDGILLQFNEPVGGPADWLAASDFRLNGTQLGLNGETVEMLSADTWVISNLANLTSGAGEYTLTLAQGSVIVDLADNPMAADNLPFRFLVVKGGTGNDTIRLKPAAEPDSVAVYVNSDAPQTPTHVFAVGRLTQIVIDGMAGNDTLIDRVPQYLKPGGGTVFHGGAGQDKLELQGIDDEYDEISIGGRRPTFAAIYGADPSWLEYDEDVEDATLLSSSGYDQVTVWDGTVQVSGSSWEAGSMLTVEDSGVVNLIDNAGSASVAGLGIVVNAGGTATFSAAQNLDSLSNSGGTITGSAVTLSGPFTQSSGTTTLTGELKGRNFTLSGGTLSTGRTTVDNVGANGTFTQNGTSEHLITNGDLVLAPSNNAYSATYTLNNGTLSTRVSRIGAAGMGSFYQNGGTHTASLNSFVGDQSTAQGTYQLIGGTFNGGYETIGYGGQATFTQSGGEHRATGSMIGFSGRTTFNLSGGSFIVSGSGYVGWYGYDTTVNHSGGSASFGTLYMAQNDAYPSYNLSGTGSLSVSGDEYLGAIGYGWGEAYFTQSGGSHSVGGTLYIGGYGYGYGYGYGNGGPGNYTLNAGTLVTGATYVGMAGWASYTHNGGVHTSSMIEVDYGQLTYAGGEIHASLVNNGYGYVSIEGGGTRTLYGRGDNYGYMKTWDTDFACTNGFYNYGTYESDPASNYFQDLTILASGALIGGVGDRFFISGNLISFSTKNQLWQTRAAELHLEGNGEHLLSVNGLDLGDGGQGYVHNFAWGALYLGSGQGLTLINGSGSEAGALYVNELYLADGIAQLQSINSNGVKIYYNPDAAANAYLGGQSYALPGGGVLASSAIGQDDDSLTPETTTRLESMGSLEAVPRADDVVLPTRTAVDALILRMREEILLFGIAPVTQEKPSVAAAQ
jgi:hypothetical protein